MNESLAVVLAALGVVTLVVGLVALWLAKSMLESVTVLWGFYHEHWMILRDDGSQTGQGNAGSEVTDEHGQAV